MDKVWRFYHEVTGVFQPGSFSSSVPDDVAASTPAGHVATDVEADPWTQRMDVSTGELVPFLRPPVSLEWDAPTARAERDRLMQASDWVTLRAFRTGQPMPPDWAAYMQALADVPEQPGFPASIDWPIPPNA